MQIVSKLPCLSEKSPTIVPQVQSVSGSLTPIHSTTYEESGPSATDKRDVPPAPPQPVFPTVATAVTLPTCAASREIKNPSGPASPAISELRLSPALPMAVTGVSMPSSWASITEPIGPTRKVAAMDNPIAPPQPKLSRPNVYERLILPDQHSVTKDAILTRTPYVINTKYMALICIECKHAVAPEKASGHARKHHPCCKISESFATEVKSKYPGLTADAIHPGTVVQPIFGLAVPEKPYEICTRCLRGYLNQASLRSHACSNAVMDLKGKPKSFSSLVQTFFREPRVCYFPIEILKPGAGNNDLDDFAIFESQRPHLDSIADEVAKPEEYRELDQFLCKEGWISHVEGYSRSEMSTLTRLPERDDVLAPIGREVFALMSNIQAAIGTAGFHVRRLLGRRPS